MNKGEFIVKFIAESAKKGKSAVEAAIEEIHEIDERLHAAERDKLRRMNLVEVCNHFGDETYRRRRNVNIPSSDDVDSSSSEFSDLRDKIVQAIGSKGPMNIRELILEVGSYDQDTLIMRAVKALGESEIVSRDTEGRVIPGRNWE